MDTQTDTNIIQAGETQRGSGMDIALFSPPMDSGVVQRQTPRKKSLFLPSAFREPRGGKQKEKKKTGRETKQTHLFSTCAGKRVKLSSNSPTDAGALKFIVQSFFLPKKKITQEIKTSGGTYLFLGGVKRCLVDSSCEEG